eukprot:7246700-Alexandrium_andersonii.AAC.1
MRPASAGDGRRRTLALRTARPSALTASCWPRQRQTNQMADKDMRATTRRHNVGGSAHPD